jgi:predicted RNA-binding protein with PIN domain
VIYLVDGYNFLFRISRSRGSLETRRESLIRELNDTADSQHLNLILIFDGEDTILPYPKRSHFHHIELVYTTKNQSADDYILEELTLSKNPKQITVVTNDRELSSRCRLFKAQALTIDAFIALIKKKQKTKKQKTEKVRNEAEFRRLLKIFEKKLMDNLEIGEEP